MRPGPVTATGITVCGHTNFPFEPSAFVALLLDKAHTVGVLQVRQVSHCIPITTSQETLRAPYIVPKIGNTHPGLRCQQRTRLAFPPPALPRREGVLPSPRLIPLILRPPKAILFPKSPTAPPSHHPI